MEEQKVRGASDILFTKVELPVTMEERDGPQICYDVSESFANFREEIAATHACFRHEKTKVLSKTLRTSV